QANPAAQVKDLETWIQKYPESDWKDDRQVMLMGAYNSTNQPARVLEIGKALMDRDVKATFLKDPKTGPSQVLTVLYLMTLSYGKLPNPTADQTAVGEKAIKALLDYVPEYFVPANKQPTVSDADWANTRKQVEDTAKGVQMAVLTRPGAEAMAKYRADKDKNPATCQTAEAAYMKAYEQSPDTAAIAYNLGAAEPCLYKIKPEKISTGLGLMARAVALDPTLGGTADGKQIEDYVNRTYTQYHGGDDAGLKQLKDMAKA